MLDRSKSFPAQPELGLRFGLTPEAFKRWWAVAITTTDADEFVHLYQGDELCARMVCAIDHLTNLGRQAEAPDVIVRAYLIARDLGDDLLHDSKVRIEAWETFNMEATQMLLGCVRQNSRRIIEERILQKTTRKIEELYERAETIGDSEELNQVERLAMQSSMQFLSLQEKAREAEALRRDKKAAAQAIAAGKQSMKTVQAIPTLDEAKQFLTMLKETYGAETFAELMKHAAPTPLPAGEELKADG